MPLLLLYLILVLGVNFLHFLLYYYLSGAPINQYNLIFTGLFSLFLLWLITLSAKHIWKFINLLLVWIIACYYIVNFLYFQVFNEFFNVWKFNSLISFQNVDFFVAYLKSVPIALYLVNGVWILVMSLIIITYKPKYEYVERLPGMNQSLINYWQSKIKKHYLWFTVFLGLGLFSTNLTYQYYITHKSADYWWQRSAQQQDFTIWGDLTYRTIFTPLKNFIGNNFAKASDDKVLTIETIDQSTNDSFEPMVENLKPLEIIKNAWQQLAKLNQQDLRRVCLNQTHFDNQPHIVFIQLESVPAWAVDQATSIMPFLKKIKQENLSVNHFFPNSCETINAEYSSLCGFFVDSSGPIPNKYSQGNYYCLPQILRDKLNYQTNLYHANNPNFWNRDQLAPRWGFDNLRVSPEFGIRASDISVLDTLANDLKNATQATFNYFISFTSHSPHAGSYLKKYNENNFDYADIPFFTLNDLPINLKNAIELTDETTNYYLSLLRAVDQSLEHFFKKLEEYNLRQNTIVFIYGDHRYYNFKPANTLENFYNYNEVPLVLVLPNNSGQSCASVASQQDLAPTLLDLLNHSDLIPENFIGNSLFTLNFPNIAVNKCLQEFTYIDDNLIVRGNSSNQEYYLMHQFQKEADTDTYLKIIPMLNKTIDVYLPKMLLGD